ncbi:hypothetical protein D3C85_722490 [compost metagenome]
MEWINRYLCCQYVDGGRGPDVYDCWGLVRHVRHTELGMRELPSYGDLRNTSPRDFTRAYRTESALMEECEPEHGAIAAVMVGQVCVHVAVVIEYHGVLLILEINPTRGPRKMPLLRWQRDHLRVTYHRDKHD